MSTKKAPLQYKTKLGKRKYSRTWIKAEYISILKLFIASKWIVNVYTIVITDHYILCFTWSHLFLSLICIISNLCNLSDIHLFVSFDQNWYSNEFSRKNDLKLLLQNHWDVHWHSWHNTVMFQSDFSYLHCSKDKYIIKTIVQWLHWNKC